MQVSSRDRFNEVLHSKVEVFSLPMANSPVPRCEQPIVLQEI
jgi:hypothetical protein